MSRLSRFPTRVCDMLDLHESRNRPLSSQTRHASACTDHENRMVSPMTAADLFVQGLRQRGVDWIATLCGHGLDPLLNAARHAGLRLVDVRNEQTCAYVADAFGRLTRRPGVCAVSSGIAQVNALSGVANASFDGAPL